MGEVARGPTVEGLAGNSQSEGWKVRTGTAISYLRIWERLSRSAVTSTDFPALGAQRAKLAKVDPARGGPVTGVTNRYHVSDTMMSLYVS